MSIAKLSDVWLIETSVYTILFVTMQTTHTVMRLHMKFLINEQFSKSMEISGLHSWNLLTYVSELICMYVLLYYEMITRLGYRIPIRVNVFQKLLETTFTINNFEGKTACNLFKN